MGRPPRPPLYGGGDQLREGFEKALVDAPFLLELPLHREDVGVPDQLDRLDDAVGCACNDFQLGCDPVERLVVEAVHFDFHHPECGVEARSILIVCRGCGGTASSPSTDARSTSFQADHPRSEG